MSLKSEIDRLRTELQRGDCERRSGKQPKWLDPGVAISGGTWVSTLSDDWILSIQPVEREAELRDAKVDYLALRLRPFHRPNFLFLERNSGGAIIRKRSIGLASSLSVDEARVRALQMEAERRGVRRLRSTAQCPRDATALEAWQRYLADDPTRVRFASLVAPYLERFGSQRVSQTKRNAAASFLRITSLSDPTLAHEQHKRLRAFFTWCVDAGVLDGNPLSRIPMPERIPGPKQRLTPDALGAIYGASKSLDEPWSRLVGFVLLTGLPIDRARRLRAAELYTNGDTLIQEHGNTCIPAASLSSRALAVAQPHASDADFLFQTERGKRRATPGHLRPSLLAKLQELSGVSGWSWRDLVENVRRQMSLLAVSELIEGQRVVNQLATAEAWSETLEHLSTCAEADPLDGVVL